MSKHVSIEMPDGLWTLLEAVAKCSDYDPITTLLLSGLRDIELTCGRVGLSDIQEAAQLAYHLLLNGSLEGWLEYERAHVAPA